MTYDRSTSSRWPYCHAGRGNIHYINWRCHIPTQILVFYSKFQYYLEQDKREVWYKLKTTILPQSDSKSDGSYSIISGTCYGTYSMILRS